MNDVANGQLLLLASPRGDWNTLLPGETVQCNLVLRNTGSGPAEVNSLSGNTFTPLLRLMTLQGHLIGEFSPATWDRRMFGHEPIKPGPPSTLLLAAGEEDQSFESLWNFTDPLAPGSYLLETAHRFSRNHEPISSNRQQFRINPAAISQVALAYSGFHEGSTLVWLGRALADGPQSRILARLSTSEYRIVNVGATPLDHVSPATRLAVSGLAPKAGLQQKPWMAIVSENTFELIRLDMTMPDWRSGPIPTAARNLRPIPGFPNRGPAVFLATAMDFTGRSVLVGLKVDSSAEPTQQVHTALWTIALAGSPARSACAFDMGGPISVLLVYEEPGRTRIARIDIDESGAVLAPERLVASSTSDLLALAVDSRNGAPLAFLILESDPLRHDYLAVHRLTLDGHRESFPLVQVAGWPSKPGREAPEPLRAAELALEVAMDGTPWIALTDERGNLFGGPLHGSPLALLRPGDPEKGIRASHPHIAALSAETAVACFTEEGLLFHTGSGGAH